MNKKIKLKYHHLGIPTKRRFDGEIYLQAYKVYHSGYEESEYGIEWMRYEKDCRLPELVKTMPHVAFEVEDIYEAIKGKKVIIEPNSPSDGNMVAFIDENGAPVEFIQVKKYKPRLKIKPGIFVLLIFFLVIFNSGCHRAGEERRTIPSKLQTNLPSGQIKDYDGNIYHSVRIGKQIWMVENLKVTHYRNGNPIPEVRADAQWRKVSSGAWCNYNNDTTNTRVYGCLYNWYAVNDSRNLCPPGWHVPSDDEWLIVTSYLGGEGLAGGKLKEAGITRWSYPNAGATNESGFTALPGGYRSIKGIFQILDTYSFYWTSTTYSESSAFSRFIQYDYEGISRIDNYKTYGFSVRCLKDN